MRDALHLVAITRRVLAALAGVALAADAVHGHGQRAVRFGADRAQAHRAGGEALDDLGRRFHLFQRDRLGRIDLELEQPAQRHVTLALVVDDLRVFLVGLELARARAVLQLGNGIRRPHVLFAAHAPGVLAAGVEHVGQHRVVAEGRAVHADRLFRHLEHADTADLRGRAAEVLLDQRLVQADGLEQLRTAVAHVGAHAHLGHDLAQALADGLDVVVDRLVGRQRTGQVLVQRDQRLQRQVRMHGLGAVAGEHGEVMHLARAGGLDHQAGGRAQALAHQVVVHGRQRQQRRDRDLLAVHAPVGDDQDVVAAADGVDAFGAQRGQLGLDAFGTPGQRVADVEFVAPELARAVLADVAQPRHVVEVEHRLVHLQPHRRVDGVDVQQVRLRPDEAVQAHDDGFADRVDRRVGHLREQLLEVVVQRLVLVRQHGQRRIVAHRAGAFFAHGGHRAHQELDVFLRGAEGLLAVEQALLEAADLALCRDRIEADAHGLDPLAVGLGEGELVLQLLVVDDAALLEIDQEHLARLQAPFAHDAVLGNRQHTGFAGHDHQVVVGDDVARRAQAVAVQRGADLLAVGEGNGGRAVPGLDHRRVVFVEGAAARVHQLVLFPGLGDHHHGRMRQRVAGHGQQLERVVEGGGVRLPLEADRVQLGQVIAQHRRLHHAFARAHPVEVALDGVDLAVVRHHAVGVGQRPFREGVGREALVHQREGRHRARIGQVLVVAAHLVGQQQALVDDGAAAHAGHVVLAAVRQLQRLDRAAGGLADDVELALQRVGHDDVGAAADEDLPDHRFLGAHCR